MSDHDPDLHRRLRDLDPPPHRDGFWAEVRAGLDAEAGDGAGDGVRTSLRARRRLPPRPLLAAAAVVAVVALAGIGVLIARDEPEAAEVVTEPGPGPTAATEPGPATTAEPGAADPDDQQPGPLRPAGDPVERGSGVPVAVDPDGEYLYVVDEASAGTGCGGAPSRALYVQPIGGGQRRLALPADQLVGAGTIDLYFSGDGRVAVHLLCEGTGASLVTGTVSDDGTIGDTFELTIPDIDTEGFVDVDELTDLAWGSEGQILATTRLVAGGTVHRHLYSFPPGPSEVSDLGVDGAIQVEVTDDGTIVTLHDDGTVRVGGEELFSAGDEAIDLDVGAMSGEGGGGSVVVAGPGVRVGSVDTPDVGAPLPLPGFRGGVTDAEIVEGTSTIVYAVAGPDGHTIRAVDAAVPDREGELITSDGATPFVLTPDGTRIFTVRGSAEGPVVIETPLER